MKRSDNGPFRIQLQVHVESINIVTGNIVGVLTLGCKCYGRTTVELCERYTNSSTPWSWSVNGVPTSGESLYYFCQRPKRIRCRILCRRWLNVYPPSTVTTFRSVWHTSTPSSSMLLFVPLLLWLPLDLFGFSPLLGFPSSPLWWHDFTVSMTWLPRLHTRVFWLSGLEKKDPGEERDWEFLPLLVQTSPGRVVDHVIEYTNTWTHLLRWSYLCLIVNYWVEGGCSNYKDL